MKKRINYGDNLYLLGLVLKDVTAGARLNVDPDLFLDRLVEDLFFLDASLGRIHELLAANPHLLDRLEHLKGLQRLCQGLAGLLDDLRAKRLPLGEHLGHFGEKFELVARNHEELARRIGRTIQEDSAHPPEESYTVSENELKFLLADIPEETES